MWNCNLCNYTTKLSANYHKHLYTETHILLENKRNEIIRKRKENKLKKNLFYMKN